MQRTVALFQDGHLLFDFLICFSSKIHESARFILRCFEQCTETAFLLLPARDVSLHACVLRMRRGKRCGFHPQRVGLLTDNRLRFMLGCQHASVSRCQHLCSKKRFFFSCMFGADSQGRVALLHDLHLCKRFSLHYLHFVQMARACRLGGHYCRRRLVSDFLKSIGFCLYPRISCIRQHSLSFLSLL